MKWKREFPTEEGNYWFFGQRWKHWNDPPILASCTVCLDGKGDVVVISQGTFVYEEELGPLWAFAKVHPPKLPNLQNLT